jgi:hypothetical protein
LLLFPNDWAPATYEGLPLYLYKPIEQDLRSAGVLLKDVASMLQESQPTPGVARSKVQDRVAWFQGTQYRIILEPGRIPELGDVWYVKHFKPY